MSCFICVFISLGAHMCMRSLQSQPNPEGKNIFRPWCVLPQIILGLLQFGHIKTKIEHSRSDREPKTMLDSYWWSFFPRLLDKLSNFSHPYPQEPPSSSSTYAYTNIHLFVPPHPPVVSLSLSLIHLQPLISFTRLPNENWPYFHLNVIKQFTSCLKEEAWLEKLMLGLHCNSRRRGWREKPSASRDFVNPNMKSQQSPTN